MKLRTMPGQITKLLVEIGDEVRAGQDVAIIEAMKMENVLSSEARGSVRSIEVKIGDNLNVDDIIMTLDLAEDDAWPFRSSRIMSAAFRRS